MSDTPENGLDRTLEEEGRTLTAPSASAAISEGCSAATEAALELPLVPRANYHVIDEVARGGLGRISRARDQRLNRTVALKELIRPTAASRARFLREIEITVRLRHPNIVNLHEAGCWPDGQLFYAMNYVAGSTLLERIDECHSQEARLALLPLIVQVAEAIALAHSQGIIHRDLKPANVLVGPFGETVVIDWGLAKYAGSPEPSLAGGAEPAPGLTREGLIVGSPPYMAPEQARGEEVDERADVYALGALLYHALSGRPPFFDAPEERWLESMTNQSPTPLRQLANQLPPDLLAIVDKALSFERADRYANGTQMALELHRFTTGRLVGAYDYRAVDLVGRFVRRNLAAVMTATVALLCLIGVAGLSVERIRHERDLAQFNAQVATRERDLARRQANTLLVTQARALTPNQPTRALAWLKQLETIPAGAVSVALQAHELGVARWVLDHHHGAVNCLAIHPDNTQLASGGDDHRVIVWSLDEERTRSSLEHRDRVATCSYSPDGRWLASAGWDGQVVLWDAETFQPHHLAAPGGAIKRLRFSDDSRNLAVADDRGVIRRYDLARRTHDDVHAPAERWPLLFWNQTQLLSGPHRGTFWLTDGAGQTRRSPITDATAAAVVSDGRVWLGLGDGRLVEWNPAGELIRPVARLDSSVTSLALASTSPPTVFAATMSGDVYPLPTSTPSSQAPRAVLQHAERAAALSTSTDGRLVASGGWDKRIRIYDTQTGSVHALYGHDDVISALSFMSDGRYLASASWDQTVRIWKLDDASKQQRRVLRGHDVGVHSVRFSHDGRRIASGGHDHTVRLWDLDGQLVRRFAGHTDNVYRVVFSPDDQWLASSSDDQTIRLSRTDGSEEHVLRGHTADVEELAFSPDGRWLASASEDHTARLWNVETGRAQVLRHRHDVTRVVFAPDGQQLATASRDGMVRVFSVPQGRLRRSLEEAGPAWWVDYSLDGRWLAAAGDGGVSLYHEAAGQRRSLPVGSARSVMFAPSSEHVAVIGEAQGFWLCEVKASSCHELVGHQSVVRAAAFSPDSSTLVSAGGEGSVYLWDVETRESRLYAGHDAPVFDVDVAPDGARIATASGDTTVRVWPLRPLPSARELPALLAEWTRQTIADEDARRFVHPRPHTLDRPFPAFDDELAGAIDVEGVSH